MRFSCLTSCVLRAHHRLSPSGFWGALRANTFPSVCGLTTTSFTDPSASRNKFSVSTITDGNARGGGRSHLPALTLAWLHGEPSPCGGARLAGDPVDSDPGAVFEDDPHPRSDAGRPARALSVSPHSGADGLVQAELPSISPYCWPCSPALPVTLARPLLPPKHNWLGQGQVRTVVPVPRGGHWPFLGSPALPPSRLTGGIATPTGRYHGRTSIRPSLPACATSTCKGDRTHAGSGPSRPS